MNGKTDQECPLCLEFMDNADVDHPVPCPTECGFNFCMKCISGLIRSSKDAPLEASDGNVAVKVKQNCPQVRFYCACYFMLSFWEFFVTHVGNSVIHSFSPASVEPTLVTF